MAPDFIITLLLSFVVILIALFVFQYIRPPVYRVEAINIKRLLESALNGQATATDWDIFLSMPIRQDPELDQIRLKCAMLASTEFSERQGQLVFSEAAKQEVTEFLRQLNKKIQVSELDHD